MRKKCLLDYCVFLIVCLYEVDLTCSLKNKDLSCTQEGPCQCIFRNGSKIDISGLTNNVFSWNVSDSTDILFHPCADTSFPNSTVSGSVFLRKKIDAKHVQYDRLGNANEGKFSDNSEGPVFIQFADGKTTISLTCDLNQIPPLLKGKEEAVHYMLELISPNSCLTETEVQSGLSTGSVLVLMFIVLSLVYFGGGVLTLKLLRGAEGKEMIPNYEFWADLPYLVRDGVLFALSGFQTFPSYDRI